VRAGAKGGDSTESLELIASLRTTVSEQQKELSELQQRLVDMSSEHEEERATMSKEISRLVEHVASLERDIETANTKKGEAEKEQEDLLVLLEEISSKRKADKVKMREAGWEVSEDEDEDEDDDDDEKENGGDSEGGGEQDGKDTA
jgi:seryl-tRNA synthetase